MRRTYALAAVLALPTVPPVVSSQAIKPAGVVARHRIESVEAGPSRVELTRVVGADSSKGHPWAWVGTGALVGGVALGAVAGITASRSNDDVGIPAGPAIVLVALIGAAAGALVGGLAWMLSH